MLRVKSPQDLGAGIVFVLIGLAGIYFGKDLAFGSASRMGPGYFPTVLSYLIVALGMIVGAKGLTVDGPPIEMPQLRPILLVNAAILAFGLLIESAGLALTTIALTFIAAYARTREGVNIRETLLLGVGLALFCVVAFVYGLNQPLPAWWGR